MLLKFEKNILYLLLREDKG